MRSKGRIFLVDDDELIIAMLSRALKNEGYEVIAETTTHGVVKNIRTKAPDLVMLDINLPGQSGMDILQEIKGDGITAQVVMLTADDTAETAVKAMKLGAADYLTKPFNVEEVKIVINNILERERLKEEVDYFRRICSELFEKEIIGQSECVKELKARIEKIAQARVSTVLITGESGTGKELMARQVHRLIHGDCSATYAPFIKVNCAALPEPLLESELFGYEKGSFTDAKTDKKGLFEQASGGSILLDEIGEMRLSLQSKLLRVLEERTLRRIGGSEEIPLELTVIATTNRNLGEAMEQGDFRMDLFYRLNAFSLYIAPLRERREDIPLLSAHFLSSFAAKYNKKAIKGFSPEAERLMVNYEWPGNVRELKNVIERLVVLENTEVILPEHLPKEILYQAAPALQYQARSFVMPETGISLDELEKDLIQQALRMAKNNKTTAAKLLNISYDSLRYQIKKFRLD